MVWRVLTEKEWIFLSLEVYTRYKNAGKDSINSLANFEDFYFYFFQGVSSAIPLMNNALML